LHEHAAAPAPTGLAGLFLVGLNHHTAAVGLREKFFTGQVELMLAELQALGLPEAGVLFTCNRIEVYGTGGTAATDAVMTHFAARCSMAIESLRSHLYIARGHEAALHLMRVAAGLESLVLGESQILGQVADAFERAQQAGTTGPVLSRVFTAAVCAGKRARTETGIGRHTLSISHAGVMLAKASRPALEKWPGWPYRHFGRTATVNVAAGTFALSTARPTAPRCSPASSACGPCLGVPCAKRSPRATSSSPPRHRRRH
jgi:hypothetical protein